MKTHKCIAPLRLLVVIIGLLTIGLSVVRAATIVSPGGLEDSEGDLSSATPTTPFRVQWLIPASDFDFLPAGGALILGHAIRSDRTQRVEATNTFADSVFTLSTTNLDNLEETFANNLGNDATVVFDGSSTITYSAAGPVEGPRPFGADVEYQTPFFYDPSLGNLLVEQISTSGSDVSGTRKDWHLTTTVSTVSGAPDAATGTLSKSVVVTRFTIIPEPSTLLLTILGISCRCCCRRRRCST